MIRFILRKEKRINDVVSNEWMTVLADVPELEKVIGSYSNLNGDYELVDLIGAERIFDKEAND